MINHQYDPIRRQHHVVIDADEIYKYGVKNCMDIPDQVVGDMVTACAEAQLGRTMEGDRKRLKHFRARFGPHITYRDLPRGKLT